MDGRTAASSGYSARDASMPGRRRPGRRTSVSLWAAILAALVSVLSVAAPASAANFAERGDAGDTRATANVPNVFPLTSITGSVNPESDRDLYKICLSGGQFTAETQTGSDPILGLFRGDGTEVAENDDFTSLESRIDGVFPAGTYYLAITSFANFSLDADTPDPNGIGFLTFDYTINLTGAAPCVPTNKEQCKNGGWRNYGTMFKNQGDCVSFVATGGKNPPSGP